MSKRVAILQSNYIPWKGYFDLIRRVDEFILFDSVQYTRRDWRNRNLIKTNDGLKWLTIPVNVKGQFLQRINETTVNDSTWAATHWKTIRNQYARAPFFAQYDQLFSDLYAEAEKMDHLSDINTLFIRAVCNLLGIKTVLSHDTDYAIPEGKNERLLGLCQQAGATLYLSGPAAKSYLDETLFRDQGIEVEWMDYSGYPEYPQLHPPFEHGVTVLDLLFNTGDEASKYLRDFKS